MMAVDCGGKLRVNNATQHMMGEGEPQESNQCTIIALEASVEWESQRWGGMPSKERVLILATAIREEEISASKKESDELGRATNMYGEEIAPILHDILHPNRPGDLGAIGFPPNARRVGGESS